MLPLNIPYVAKLKTVGYPALPTPKCDFYHLLLLHQLETVRLPRSQPEPASISEQNCMTIRKLHLTKLVSTRKQMMEQRFRQELGI